MHLHSSSYLNEYCSLMNMHVFETCFALKMEIVVSLPVVRGVQRSHTYLHYCSAVTGGRKSKQTWRCAMRLH